MVISTIGLVVSFFESLGISLYFQIALLVVTFNLDFLEWIKDRLAIRENELKKAKNFTSTQSSNDSELGAAVYVFQGIVIALAQWGLRIIVIGLPWVLVSWMFTLTNGGPSSLLIALILIFSTLFFTHLGRCQVGTYLLYDTRYHAYIFGEAYYTLGNVPTSRKISDLFTFFLVACVLIAGISLEVKYYQVQSALMTDKFAVVDNQLLFHCEEVELDEKSNSIKLITRQDSIPKNWTYGSWTGSLMIPNNPFTSDFLALLKQSRTDYLMLKFGDNGEVISVSLIKVSYTSSIVEHQNCPKIELIPSSLWILSDKVVTAPSI